MTVLRESVVPLEHTSRFFIGGEWVSPEHDSVIDVIDPATEELFFSVAEAQAADISRAVDHARAAFDTGPWPRLSHRERAEYLTRIAAGLRARGGDLVDIWPREAGALAGIAAHAGEGAAATFDFYADLAETFLFEEAMPSRAGAFGLRVYEPVGVVGAIVPWNSALSIATYKIAPALLAGCTVVLKMSPEAPGEGYLLAEIARAAELPPGVLNVVTANREASELLVRDPRVDKISFTGSTAVGRRIASICGERIARATLELGGKSAAVVLDDADLTVAAETLAAAECLLNGQVCASLTRLVVTESRHDQFVDALADAFSRKVIGDPYDPATQIGPLAASRQRDRVEGYIAKGIAEGAVLVTGGGRPKHLERGWYVEPTIFGNVASDAVIAQEEIFGPVLSVLPARDEDDAVAIANDTIYGLNAAVFTSDVDRAREVAAQLKSGIVGHNGFRADYKIGVGGFKQSGIGREGGVEGLRPYLEMKAIILDDVPTRYRD